MPGRVREMKAEVQDIMDNWKEHNFSRLYHPSFQGQPGWIGEEKCEEMVQAFGKEVLNFWCVVVTSSFSRRAAAA